MPLPAGSESLSFELGPSRPPSEAYSLLLRVTRGCSWHRCEFCSSHRTSKLQMRTVAEIKKDIETAKLIADQIEETSRKLGYGGDVKQAAAALHSNPPNDSFRIVALWLHFGGETVFLQDANSLIMRTPELAEVLRFLKQTFPGITRVTSYARSQTAAQKTLEELTELHQAGLSRLHIGLESGCDEVLKFVQKGVTAGEHISGGRKVVESGISLCEYVMPGLGGRQWSQKHTTETARVLNAINPDFIRLRSLMLREDLPLYQKWQNGQFELLTDDEVVEEIAGLVRRLEVTSYLASDHIENLLQEVEGQLPQAKEKMLEVIGKYLALPPEERLNFRLGRRAGYYTGLDELASPYKHDHIEQTIKALRSRGENIEDVIFNLKKGFLV